MDRSLETSSNNAQFTEQLRAIRKTLDDFEAIMTQAGAARWRLQAEHAAREGKEHLKQIEAATKHLKEEVAQHCESIEEVSGKAVTRIQQSVSAVKPEEFHAIYEQSHRKLLRTAEETMGQVGRVARWFHWEKVILALFVALLTAFSTSLFLIDELPWETHQRAQKERMAGQMLLKAWPSLTQQQKAAIQQVRPNSHS